MARCFGDLSLVTKAATDRDLTCVKYIDKGEKILTGSSDGLVRVYNSGTLELIRTFGTSSDNEFDPMIPVTDVTGLPLRNAAYLSYFMATYTNGYVKLWNIHKGGVATTLDEQRQTLGISFSPILSNFVTVGDDAAIYLYDEKTMSVIQTLKSSDSMGKVDGHTSRVFCAEFHPAVANDFVSGGWDNTIQFWDTRRPTSVRFITGPHICGHGISFKPAAGKEMITASYAKENPLQRWDYSTGKLLLNYETDLFKSMLYCGSWLNEDIIATGGTDPSMFRVINAIPNNTIGYFRTQQTGVYSMDFKFKSNSIDNSTATDQTKPKKHDDSIGIRCVICAGRFIIELDVSLSK